jgi:hypothetical protein
MLLVLMPVPYVEASAAYAFPDKRNGWWWAPCYSPLSP